MAPYEAGNETRPKTDAKSRDSDDFRQNKPRGNHSKVGPFEDLERPELSGQPIARQFGRGVSSSSKSVFKKDPIQLAWMVNQVEKLHGWLIVPVPFPQPAAFGRLGEWDGSG